MGIIICCLIGFLVWLYLFLVDEPDTFHAPNSFCENCAQEIKEVFCDNCDP